jgi:hypothetical protein
MNDLSAIKKITNILAKLDVSAASRVLEFVEASFRDEAEKKMMQQFRDNTSASIAVLGADVKI